MINLEQFMNLIQTRNPNYVMPSQYIVPLFYTLLEFVFFLGTQDYYHNDIKPENIVLSIHETLNQSMINAG